MSQDNIAQSHSNVPDEIDPDAVSDTNTTKPPLPEEMEPIILAHAVHNDQCVKMAAKALDPKMFTSKAYKMLFAVVKEQYEQTGKRASLGTLKALCEIELQQMKPKDQTWQRGMVNTICDYSEAPDPEIICRQISSLAAQWHTGQAFSKYIESRDLPTLLDAMDEVRRRTAVEIPNALETLPEMMERLEAEEWLLPNWLEFGSLALLSGDPFSGKSNIMAELYAAIAKGGKFGHHQAARCGILVIDAENKRRIFAKRLDAALAGDRGDIDSLLIRIVPEQMSFPLADVEVLRQLIQSAKASTRQDRILVVVDTLRSVFSADEMENDEMKSLLYPLQRVAQEENAAILVLHHRPKSGAKYAGQTSIAGACDFLWMWESDKLTQIGHLTLEGTRGDNDGPMSFEYRNGKNHFRTTAAKEQSVEELIINTVLDAGTINQKELVKVVGNLVKGDVGQRKLVEKIHAFVDAGTLEAVKGPRTTVLYRIPDTLQE
jgi:hypothetical protein